MTALFVALLLGLALGFLGSVPVAGPVSTMVFDRAIADQPREARAVGVGSGVAEGLCALLSFYGYARVLRSFPAVIPVTRAVGAAIFVGLGLYLALRRPPVGATIVRRDTGRRWLLGFTVSALNPTIIISWTGVIAALHGAGVLSPDPADALPFATGVACGSAFWFVLLVSLLTRHHGASRPAWLLTALRAVGWAFVATGLVIGTRLVLERHWL